MDGKVSLMCVCGELSLKKILKVTTKVQPDLKVDLYWCSVSDRLQVIGTAES